MLKKILGKYGIIASTVIISLICILVSILVTAALWIVLRQPNIHVAILTAFICPSLIAPPLFFSYSRLTVELQKKSQEAKQINEELKESEKKFRQFVENTTEGVGMMDINARITYANRSMCEMFGYPEDELIGRSPIDFLDEENLEIFKKYIAIRKKESVESIEPYEISFIKKDGSIFQTIVAPQIVKDSSGSLEGSFALITDITERKKLEEERLKVQKLESTGVLAGGIAHDFNNILTAILGNLSLAKIHAASNKKVIKTLSEVEKASLRAKDLSQRLLTFSKGGEPIKKPTKLNELIKDSASFALTGSNVKCKFFMTDNLWEANIDEGQISQVIQNVVKNADQAMIYGGTVTIQAENKTISSKNALHLKKGEYIWIKIKDQGAGIPKRHISKIFDPYFSTKQEGSGLGLATSFSIVKNHNGFITAESESDAGTTFHIYLPAFKNRSRVVKKSAKEKSFQSGKKILVMDDDPAILKTTSKMLDMMGFKAETVTNGQEAIELYKKALTDGRPFGAVLLDLTIPGGMGGKETVKQLADIDPEVNAVVTSGYSNDPILADYKRHGFRCIVAKPYGIEELVGALHDLVN
jgi:PAS domain S-box-containing protein